MSDQPLSELFVKTCQLGYMMSGHEKLNKIQGCWEHQVNDDWHVTLNPHLEPTCDSKGEELGPFTLIAKHKGMPVFTCDPYGGAGLTGAEGDFIEILDSQLKSAEPTACSMQD